MKATGIVRRLDDLGRLVIPKEMRRQYQLREGDSIEFFTEDDRIIIEKHNVFSRYMEEIELMCDILKKTYGHTVLFLHAEWLHKHQVKVSESFIRHAGVHRTVRFSDEKIYAGSDMREKGAIFPVTVFGDWYGAFVIVEGAKPLVSEEIRTVEAFAALLSRQQEH